VKHGVQFQKLRENAPYGANVLCACLRFTDSDEWWRCLHQPVVNRKKIPVIIELALWLFSHEPRSAAYYCACVQSITRKETT